MSVPFTTGPARPDELADVFRLVFRQVPPEEREDRVANALSLVQSGELDPRGVLAARHEDQLLGVLICLPVPGASALVWPPVVVAGKQRQAVEDQLLRHATDWLRGRGCKLGQSLLNPDDLPLAEPLRRHGFVHITGLWYMRHYLDLSAELLGTPERLAFSPYPNDPEVFEQTLLRTYEDTRDCPEVNGVRTLAEVMEGHRAQGRHQPHFWWLARAGSRPVGVLLLTALVDSPGWDVSYVGVVPEARRRGVGRELMRKALFEARAAGASQLTLSVDARNDRAWNLYRSMGFEPYERREVFLAVWSEVGKR